MIEAPATHLLMPINPWTVEHEPEEQRFVADIGGWVCHLDYALEDGVMRIFHTEVAPALEGRGIAASLVNAALEFSQAAGLKVAPHCSYVRAYLRRFPEWSPLVVQRRP